MLGEIGDGTLSSFQSAVDAVNCAREIQAALEKDPDLRIRIGSSRLD
jgi:adenylate cyclase